MNREQLIWEYHIFLTKEKMVPKDAVLNFGGACVMFGIRDQTSDLDIEIETSMYSKLFNSNLYPTKKSLLTKSVIWSRNIELFDLKKDDQNNTVMIDGVCCFTPRKILEYKLLLNRDKDQSDIKKLRVLIDLMK